MKTTAFLNVFESKLEKLIDKIKAEYQKPKNERNRESLKSLAKEAKALRKLVREMQEQAGIKEICCPHCNKSFKVTK